MAYTSRMPSFFFFFKIFFQRKKKACGRTGRDEKGKIKQREIFRVYSSPDSFRDVFLYFVFSSLFLAASCGINKEKKNYFSSYYFFQFFFSCPTRKKKYRVVHARKKKGKKKHTNSKLTNIYSFHQIHRHSVEKEAMW
jgi:hypothetical protein